MCIYVCSCGTKGLHFPDYQLVARLWVSDIRVWMASSGRVMKFLIRVQGGRTPAILFSLDGNESKLLSVDALEMKRQVRPLLLPCRLQPARVPRICEPFEPAAEALTLA